jgi:hypothetical protein
VYKRPGLVRNVSANKLKNIEVVVSWFTEDGVFITSDTALIEFTTLMPDQESPFKVLEPANPLMKKARLEFKDRFGNKIRTHIKK